VAHEIGAAQMDAFTPTRIGLIIAGLEVPHVHLHVVPRVVGDAFRFENDWRTADRAELDATAAVLRQVQQEQPAPYPRGTR